MENMSTAKKLAFEILHLEQHNTWLIAECERLKDIEKKYDELITQSINHSNQMIGNILRAELTKAERKKYLVTIVQPQDLIDEFNLEMTQAEFEFLKRFSSMSESNIDIYEKEKESA